MNWIKKGVLFSPEMYSPKTTAIMTPTPDRISGNNVRVYISPCDETYRAYPSYVDVSFEHSTPKIIAKGPRLFNLGFSGTFDDNGIVITSILTLRDGIKYLYYVGFELCEKIRYRLFSGLAISYDYGATFKRYSKSPILDRSDKELYFRCSPYVVLESGVFRMWYVAGDSWDTIDGKSMPIYLIKYLESKDGIHWGDCGKVCINIESPEEHGFGRPYVIKDENMYKMYYCKRVRHLGYRMGYAESKDGVDWIRKDSLMNLDVSKDGWDSEMVCYPSLIKHDDRWIMFYNGNGFGKTGFGYAELVSE